MIRIVRSWVPLALLALCALSTVTRAAGVQLTPEQQQAAEKLKAKGGSVMPLAADSDALVVNLGLAGQQACDEELALVKTLSKVVELDLHGTAVTNAGLANLEGMKDLTKLRLDRTKVGDEGVAHLKGLTNLVYLNLYDTPVTDAGLEHLKDLKSLKRLYLWQSKVTDAGAAALHKALPEATINRGEGMAALAAVKGEQSNAPAATVVAGKPVNAKCPVTGKDVDPTKLVVFEGKTIGFCCEKCPAEFQKDPKKFVALIPELNPKKPEVAAVTPTPETFKPDDDGFIRNWLVLAPVPFKTTDGAAVQVDQDLVSGENELKPKAGDKTKVGDKGDKELAWKAAKAKDYFFDLNEVVGSQTNDHAAYAVCYIESGDERKDLQLRIGSDDHAKVYLNGREVLNVTGVRGVAKDQNRIGGLTLNKGTNVLLVKVINEGGAWQGCARFTDKAGKPVKDLKIKTAP